MANNLTLDAEIRADVGKGASRRLRNADKVPAIVYGAGKEPQAITLEHHKVIKALENEEFYSQIITLNLASKKEQVVLKDLQRHAYKPKITHLDFLRVKADEEITMLIPLHFIDEDAAPGITQGGIVTHLITEVEIQCLPANLPKAIDVDVSAVELNGSIHLSELKLPKGTAFATTVDEEHDQPVLSIHLARMAEAPTEAPEAEGEEEAPEAEQAEGSNNKE